MSRSIVVVDGYALNPGDLTWSAIEALGELTVHDRTPADQIASRSARAEAVLTNKVPYRREILAELKKLRYIGVLATGYDIVDVAAAREHGIAVTNIPTYGTNSVAQFAFALLLELCHRVQNHADDVRSGGWSRNPDWSYHLSPLVELAGKTIGVVGYGRIGRQVGAIARALGMQVVAFDPAVQDSVQDAEMVSFDDLLARADVISLHSPLTPENRGLINRDTLVRMKPTAILINTARGPLVVDRDLAEALNAGKLGGAALDVLSTEPPPADHPLLSARNCLVTPHIAWATREARARLMQIAAENLVAFFAGKPQNVVS
jgi:glycerate dehydrogenase